MSELILGPIIGGLTATGAYLWGRTTDEAVLYAWLGGQPDLSDAQLVGESLSLSQETGFAGLVPLEDLTPETSYHYALTLTESPPEPTDGAYPSFTTFPAEGQRRSFSFAFGSCFWPMEDSPGAIFEQIEALRHSSQDDPKNALRFILMLGDQIYADGSDHNGLGSIATTLDEFRQVYHYTWSQPPFREMLANLPAFMTLDDHEVDDDWAWTDFERRKAHIPIWNRFLRWIQGKPKEVRQITRERVQAALQAYWEHQGMHAREYVQPPELTPAGRYALARDDPGSLAYTFNYGAAAFFRFRYPQHARQKESPPAYHAGGGPMESPGGMAKSGQG